MFADTLSCTELFEHAHAYTTKHFMEVTKNQEFLLLSANEVAKLLESEDLNVPSEETIFHVKFICLEISIILEIKTRENSIIVFRPL